MRYDECPLGCTSEAQHEAHTPRTQPFAAGGLGRPVAQPWHDRNYLRRVVDGEIEPRDIPARWVRGLASLAAAHLYASPAQPPAGLEEYEQACLFILSLGYHWSKEHGTWVRTDAAAPQVGPPAGPEREELLRRAQERIAYWVDHSDCLEDKEVLAAIDAALREEPT